MNLYLRLLILIIRSFGKPTLGLLESSVLKLRVLPNDLDLNMHMNNGRFLSIMDLGRTDLVLRNGLIDHVVQKRWMPIVGNIHMRYRRPLKPFQKYELITRVVSWDEKWIFMEQIFSSNNKVVAIGLVKGLLRGPEGNIPNATLMEALNHDAEAPDLPEDFRRLQEFSEIQ